MEVDKDRNRGKEIWGNILEPMASEEKQESI